MIDVIADLRYTKPLNQLMADGKISYYHFARGSTPFNPPSEPDSTRYRVLGDGWAEFTCYKGDDPIPAYSDRCQATVSKGSIAAGAIVTDIVEFYIDAMPHAGWGTALHQVHRSGNGPSPLYWGCYENMLYLFNNAGNRTHHGMPIPYGKKISSAIYWLLGTNGWIDSELAIDDQIVHPMARIYTGSTLVDSGSYRNDSVYGDIPSGFKRKRTRGWHINRGKATLAEYWAFRGGATPPPPDPPPPGPDTTRPTVEMLTPLTGATVASSMEMKVKYGDNVKVTSVIAGIVGDPVPVQRVMDPTGTETTFTFTIPASLVGTSRWVWVEVADAAGNKASDSAQVNFGPQAPPPPPPDTTPPVLTITSPAPGEIIDTDEDILVVQVNATDASGIVRAEFYMAGNLVVVDTDAPWTAEIPISDLPSGEYDINVVVVDTAGNPASSTVSVDLVGDSVDAILEGEAREDILIGLMRGREQAQVNASVSADATTKARFLQLYGVFEAQINALGGLPDANPPA